MQCRVLSTILVLHFRTVSLGISGISSSLVCAAVTQYTLAQDGDILFQGPASDYDGKKVNAIWEALIECADTTCEDSSDAM